MKVIVNGEPRAVAESANVAELVAEMKLIPETLLIEHNGVALRRREWESLSLREGDRLEFLRVVAGG